MSDGKNRIHFSLMKWGFALRDRFRPPGRILDEVPIETGMVILDFGCGPGAFSEAAGERVGPGGKIVAVDRVAEALRSVEKRFRRRGWTHIITVRSEGETGLPRESVDGILMFDVYHDLEDPARILGEMHRILRKNGFLSVSDHHMESEQLYLEITATGCFRMERQEETSLLFRRTDG